jgi:hypothetical protein
MSQEVRDLLAKAAEHYGATETLFFYTPSPIYTDEASQHMIAGDGIMHQVFDLFENSLDENTLYIEWDCTKPRDMAPTVLKVPSLSTDVLLKLKTGEQNIAGRTHRINVTSSGDGKNTPLTCAPDGTTWILLEFREIPEGASILTFEITADGDDDPSQWGGIQLETGTHGNLSLTILDETGAETPALVRLTSPKTGYMWEPPNAVDLSPIMTNVTGLSLYGPGRGYPYFFLDDLRGPYWIVPGPFETVIPPGTWKITIPRGPEYLPYQGEVVVNEGEITEKTIQLTRWIEMPAKGWYSGDDHVHSRLISSQDADSLMNWSKAADVHVANILEMGTAGRTWYEQRGFGQRFQVIDGDFALVPGQEDPRFEFGHIIGLNLKEIARNTSKYVLYDWVANAIHEQGGLYGGTHVGLGYLGIFRDLALNAPHGHYDFVSIMQVNLGTDLYYNYLNLGFKLTASAGSDTPYAGGIGFTRLYAYIGKDTPFSTDAWFEAMRKGNTFVTNGPILELNTEDGHIPGNTIIIDSPDEVINVSAKALGYAGGTAPVNLEIVWNGNVMNKAYEPSGESESLTVEHELKPGDGGWLAARAVSKNGTEGHTSPIYIHRKGYRHWNRDLAEELIAKQERILDEMEEMALEQKGRLERGEMSPLDSWNGPLGEQADELIVRIEKSRAAYRDLRDTLKRELSE